MVLLPPERHVQQGSEGHGRPPQRGRQVGRLPLRTRQQKHHHGPILWRPRLVS